MAAVSCLLFVLFWRSPIFETVTNLRPSLNHVYFCMKTIAAFLFAVPVWLVLPVHARLIYVNEAASGSHDGSSWATAYTYLQDALEAAEAGDEIWVSAGTYRPDQGSAVTLGDRTASFHLKPEVALYGGFAGNELERDERDWEGNGTVLSGDLQQNDGPELQTDHSSRAENSIHVVVGDEVDSSTILDGFSVTGGNANQTRGPYDGGAGGGMFHSDSDAVIVNCRFVENSARHGGAVHVERGSPAFRACTFARNYGGGMGNSAGSNLSITRCVFLENRNGWGGGMTCSPNSSTVITDTLFQRNESSVAGGGIHSQGGLLLIGVIFAENHTSGDGGGISVWDGLDQKTVLINCVLTANRAEKKGGGFSNRAETVWIANSTVHGNSAGESGGGIANILDGNAQVQKLTITIENSILWENQAANPAENQIGNDADPGQLVFEVNHCLIEGDHFGTAIIDNDPVFAAPTDPVGPDGVFGTGDDGLALRESSSAIDGGSTLRLPFDLLDLDDDGNTNEPLPIDVSGAPRVSGENVDLGAYEFPSPGGPGNESAWEFFGANFWSEATDLGSGWKWLGWFGYFNDALPPWFFHLQHSWKLPMADSASSIYFWTAAMGWWWISPDIYPDLYSFSHFSWLQYAPDTSLPRVFFNYKSQSWEPELMLPKLVKVDFIELDKIVRVSRFRSGVGHDYSDSIEPCRSMKHYFEFRRAVDCLSTRIYSPVNGKIENLLPEWAGTKVDIRCSDAPEYVISIFHVGLLPSIEVGADVIPGQQLGNHANCTTMSDIAVAYSPEFQRDKYQLFSYFDVMENVVLARYLQRGASSRLDFIISRELRDADPLVCDSQGRFAEGNNIPSWVTLY